MLINLLQIDGQIDELTPTISLTYEIEFTGRPKKMFLSEIGALLTKEHFFWDTW